MISDTLHSYEYNISYIRNLVNCWEALKLRCSWVISSQASRKKEEGSTTIETTCSVGKGVEYTSRDVEAPGCPFTGHKIWSELYRNIQMFLVKRGFIWYSSYIGINYIKRMIMKITVELMERFYEKWQLNKVSGCWEWTAALSPNGYGQIKRPGERKQIPAHRLSYLIHYKEDISKSLVCHTCDNRICVKPSHLFLGTYKDNSQDMVNKGRDLHGSKHPGSKLTVDKVIALHKMRDEGKSIGELARIFGVSQGVAWRISKGISWKKVFKSLYKEQG